MPVPATPESDPPAACPHRRVQVVARKQGYEYFECLDCRSILEPEDLERTPEAEPEAE